LCPVTQSGRELSQQQLDAILKMHPAPLVVSFDGDAAGQESNQRLVRAVLTRGRGAILVKLPEGTDPASWLADNGPKALATWLLDRSVVQPAFTASVRHFSAVVSTNWSRPDFGPETGVSPEADV